MNWNHRVVKTEDGTLMLAEVSYYDDKPAGYSEPFMIGDTVEELEVLVARLKDALLHPILNESDFVAPPDLEEEDMLGNEMLKEIGILS